MAHEDLESERARSRSLSDDVDHLKKALQEKEDAVLQSGKLIQDLWVRRQSWPALIRRSRGPTLTWSERTQLSRRRSTVSFLRPYVYFIFAMLVFYHLIPYFDLCRA